VDGSSAGEWLDLVADLMSAPLVRLPVERIAVQLTGTFDAVGCAFSSQQADGVLSGGIYPLDEQFGGHRAELEDWRSRNARRLHPVLLQYQATGYPTLVQVADVPERFADRRIRGAWREIAGPWGCPEQLALPLPAERTGHRAFVIGRGSPFSAAEVGLARRLWQLLVGLDRQVQAISLAPPQPAVAADLRLTPRELAVLGLLAEGCTAAAIGRRLAVAERTVHKHLEHAYAKLGVSDRLSAVLRVRRLGLLAG
jgi:DNA-binding CsgD family transcriptional regulator